MLSAKDLDKTTPLVTVVMGSKSYLEVTEEALAILAEVRSDDYEMLRNLSTGPASFSDLTLQLPDVEISTLQVGVRSVPAGRSLAQMKLRKRYGVTVLAIRRASQILPNPLGETHLCANDVLFVLGPPEKIARTTSLFHNSGEREVSE